MIIDKGKSRPESILSSFEDPNSKLADIEVANINHKNPVAPQPDVRVSKGHKSALANTQIGFN